MLKRTLAASATLLAVAVPAHAQDLAGTALDWSGFYAGVYGGYALGSEPTRQTILANFVTGSYVLSGTEAQGRVQSPFAGAEVGYNFQHGPLVFGLNADLSVGDFTQEFAASLDAISLDPLRPDIDYGTMNVWTTSAVGTITGRLGFAADNWLVYGKAGVAIADVGRSQSWGVQLNGGPQIGELQSRRGLNLAPVVGVGAEVAVAESISIGAEYTYTHFLADPLVTPTDIPGYGTIYPETPKPVTFHALKIGAKYHF